MGVDLSRVDLPAMVAQTVRLTRLGKRWKGCCPFHEEKTGSFQLIPDPSRWRFHCFGCGAHGDAIDWVRLAHKVSFKEASRMLGQQRIVPPSQEEQMQRRLKTQRTTMLKAYHNYNPDCCIPDWAIA